MIESDWNIKTGDGKTIYGRLIQAGDKPFRRVIVFVHGLLCDYTNQPYLAASYAFAKKGYDCLLFNLYDWRPGARHVRNGTLKTFGRDVDTVLASKATRYNQIFLIGHSYGGPSILHANPARMTAISLWDPSYDIADWWPQWTFSKNGVLFFKGPMDVVLPAAMNREALSFDVTKCSKMGKAFPKPMQVIHAGQGILYKYGASYHTAHTGQHDYHLIQNADHCFTSQSAFKDVVAKTDRWFRQFK